MVERYVRFAGRWRWPIAVGWILAVVGAALVAQSLPDRLSGGGWGVRGSDSEQVARLLEEGYVGRGPSTVTVVVHDRWYSADQPGFEPRVDAVVEAIVGDPELDVRSAVGWSSLGPETRAGFLGADGRTAIEVLGLGLPDGIARNVVPLVQADLEAYAEQGMDVSLVSTAAFWGEITHLSEEGLVRAETITLPLILLVLLLLFGGVVAALASLSVGVTSILFTFAVLSVISRQYELSVFVQNTATMLGLGVGVDYSLFVIARFKEELAGGRSVDDALAATLRTSGETVLFSGVTIVAAMCTLFLVPLGVIASIALGAVVVVAFSVLTSVLLLPVLLRLLGRRIERGRVGLRRGRHRRGSHRGGGDRWEALAARIMRRPVRYLTLGLAVMLTLAAPSLALQTFTPDAEIIPTSSPVRQGFDLVQEQFGVGSTAPFQVVVQSAAPFADDSATASAALADLQARLTGLDTVDRVDSALQLLVQVDPEDPIAALSPAVRDELPDDVAALVGRYASADGRGYVLEVVSAAPAADPATQRLLTDVRAQLDDLPAGMTASAGGETAQGVDSNEVIEEALPLVVLVMLAVIYLLLLLTFRSLLLPLKAILMNLLSVGATFGVLVVVFQWGFGAALIGVEEPTYIQNFVPVLLLALLFSLSTDYEVFLLNRVRENYVATGDNDASVARGLAQTAPLISGAALLMVVVFGAFAFAGVLPIKQLGFGLAVGILLDATIVRLIIVPAAMRLMGSWNWWLPGRPTPAPPGRAPDSVQEPQPTPVGPA